MNNNKTFDQTPNEQGNDDEGPQPFLLREAKSLTARNGDFEEEEEEEACMADSSSSALMVTRYIANNSRWGMLCTHRQHITFLRVLICILFASTIHLALWKDCESQTTVLLQSIETESQEPHMNMPKVAHCFAGQARTLAHPMIYENYEAHVFSKIEASSDSFFATDSNNTGLTVFGPKTVYIAASVTNQYERWSHCLEIIKDEEVSSGIQYSHIIISRPDLLVLQNLPSIDAFPKKSIWLRYSYPEYVDEYPSTLNVGDESAENVTSGDLGLSDMFHIIPRYMAKPFITTMAQAPSECGASWNRTTLCGKSSGAPECGIKCSLATHAFPFVPQNFQVRILREHSRKNGCYFGGGGSIYNRMCL